jgi:phage terminase large subunit-like protein
MDQEFRNKIREMGPVKFAQEILGYVLSNDQIELLNELWIGKYNYIQVLAPRGSGKTLCMAIFTCWLLIVENNYEIHVMGGSSGQSRRTQKFIDDFRRKNPEIKKILPISTYSPMNKGVRTESIYSNIANFTSCSTKSAKSPHPSLLVVDEMCEGEREPNDAEAIEAAFGEVQQSNSRCIMLSTCDYLNGKFAEFWIKKDEYPEIKRFQWSIVEHVSGKPLENYRDTNPLNWNVKKDIHWFDDKKIREVRNMMDSNWWLVNVLAGLSVGSGNVFNVKQLKIIDFSLISNLKFEEVRMGIDLGFSVSRDPTAIVVCGIANGRVWVLFYEEVNIAQFNELIEYIEEKAKEHHVETIYVDPSASSQAYISTLESKDFICPDVADIESRKEYRVQKLISVVERGKIIFDEDCERLVNSLKALHYLKGTREIAKVNDHGFDALTYALCDLDLSFFEDDSAGPDIKDPPKPDYGETMRKWGEMMRSSPEAKKPDEWRIRGENEYNL